MDDDAAGGEGPKSLDPGEATARRAATGAGDMREPYVWTPRLVNE
jgi:hypothetical protein